MRKTYKEAMNQLTVSDELRGRVLAAASVKGRQHTSPSRWLKPVCGAAACVAVIGAAAVWLNISKNSNLNMAGSTAGGMPASSAGTSGGESQEIQSKEKGAGGVTYYSGDIAPEAADGAAPQNNLAENEEENGSFDQGMAAMIANPVVPYETIEDAETALSFSPAIPASLSNLSALENSEVVVIDNSLLQISWQEGDVQYTYRTALGEQDISGNYESYQLEEVVEVSGEAVTLKGEGETFSLAVWQEDGQSFSVAATPGAGEEKLTALAEEVLTLQIDSEP